MNRRSLLQGLLGLPLVPAFFKDKPPPPEDDLEATVSTDYHDLNWYMPGATYGWKNPNVLVYKRKR